MKRRFTAVNGGSNRATVFYTISKPPITRIMPKADGWVSLGIQTDTKKRLEERGDMTDSFDDVVSRLLDQTADDGGDS